MAKQCGIIKLTGTIGGITFYKTKDGYFARTKGGVTGERFQTDAKFTRSRENASEFGRAGAAGGVFRKALKGVFAGATDRQSNGRLTRVLMEVLQGDTIHARGQRRIQDGNLNLLRGFEPLGGAPLSATLAASFRGAIDRHTGTATIQMPTFDPSRDIEAPAGATHFNLVAVRVKADFEARISDVTSRSTSIMSVSGGRQPAWNPVLDSTGTIPANLPIILMLGIQFYQKVNGMLYPLANGAHQALTIIAVDDGKATVTESAIPETSRMRDDLSLAPVSKVSPAQSPRVSVLRARCGRGSLSPSSFRNLRTPSARRRIADRPPCRRSDIKVHSPP
jgi:hypothetical protein